MQAKNTSNIQSQITRRLNQLLKIHSPSVAAKLLRLHINNAKPPFDKYREQALQMIGKPSKKDAITRARSKFNNNWKLKNAIFARDGYRCAIRLCNETRYLQVDHIRPLSKYPEMACSPSNLRILCRKHNIAKGFK